MVPESEKARMISAGPFDSRGSLDTGTVQQGAFRRTPCCPPRYHDFQRLQSFRLRLCEATREERRRETQPHDTGRSVGSLDPDGQRARGTGSDPDESLPSLGRVMTAKPGALMRRRRGRYRERWVVP